MTRTTKQATALVTGASRGIGFAIARQLLEDGYRVLLVARPGAVLDAAMEHLRAGGYPSVEARPCDLEDGDALDALATGVEQLDVLVNCAGAIPSGGMLDVTEAVWRRSWDLKVFGYVKLCRALFATLSASGNGVICNVIGDSGEQPMGHYIYGSMANASLIAFTKALGPVAIADNVRVFGINPGLTKTERMVMILRGRAQQMLGDDSRWEEMFDPRKIGEAEDIARVAAFLISPAGRHVNATVVTVNGGHNGATVPIGVGQGGRSGA